MSNKGQVVKVLENMTNPREIGQAEYALVYELVEDIARTDPDNLDLLRASLRELESWAATIQLQVDDNEREGLL